MMENRTLSEPTSDAEKIFPASLVVMLLVAFICAAIKECTGNGSNPPRHGGCKAQGCLLVHQQHHCCLCGHQDSDHCSSKCPRRFKARLFHGTLYENVASIRRSGLLAGNQNCRLGQGAYFTSNLDQAKAIAREFDPCPPKPQALLLSSPHVFLPQSLRHATKIAGGRGTPCVVHFKVNLGEHVKSLYHDESGATLHACLLRVNMLLLLSCCRCCCCCCCCCCYRCCCCCCCCCCFSQAASRSRCVDCAGFRLMLCEASHMGRRIDW
jgi:hypothetical protein